MITRVNKIHAVSRIGLAFMFFYHGFFPKLYKLSEIEIILASYHAWVIPAKSLAYIAGIIEIALGFSILLFRTSHYPIYVAAFALMILLIDVSIVMPSLLIEAFNPVTLNISGLILCYITYESSQLLENS